MNETSVRTSSNFTHSSESKMEEGERRPSSLQFNKRTHFRRKSLELLLTLVFLIVPCSAHSGIHFFRFPILNCIKLFPFDWQVRAYYEFFWEAITVNNCRLLFVTIYFYTLNVKNIVQTLKLRIHPPIRYTWTDFILWVQKFTTFFFLNHNSSTKKISIIYSAAYISTARTSWLLIFSRCMKNTGRKIQLRKTTGKQTSGLVVRVENISECTWIYNESMVG